MENLENINVAAEDAVTPVEDVADTVAEVDEEFDDFDSDAEFDLDFEARRSRIKNPVRRFLFGKKYIGFAFLVPAVLMTLIYVALGVWPVGERSALVLDLNAQYVYFIEKFRSILVDGGSFLYSFERALGGEFMGIVAYYIASPFNLLTVLFPKAWMTEVVMAIMILKCGFCGLNFAIYAHGRFDRRRPVATIIFASMYALCSFGVVMQNNLMWIDCMLLFPLVLLGMERLIKYGRYKLYTLTLALAVFSNYYIGYMMCLFLVFYFFVRYLSMTSEERNPRRVKLHFLKTLPRMLIFSVIAVMMAAVMILSAYYSLKFGKLEFSEPSFEPRQLYDFSHIIAKLFFGTYDTVRPEGVPFLYAGMLMTILIPLFFITPGIPARRKAAGGFMMALFIVSINLSTADLVWHGFQRPNWLNARFTFMFIFVMLIMAYEVFIRIKELGFSKVVVSGGVLCAILVALQQFEISFLDDLMSVWISIGIIGIYLITLRFTHEASRRSYVTLSSVILAIIVALDLFASGVLDVYGLNEDVLYSNRASYRDFLDKYYEVTDYVDEREGDSFYREEKLNHRKTNDNFALGIKGLSNSTSTLNSDVIDLLRRFGFTSKSHWSKYVGGTIPSDAFFGIKYIYADQWGTSIPDYIKENYEEIYKTEDYIAVYENPYAMSVAFGVESDILKFKTEEKPLFTDPFEYMNTVYSLMSGEEELQLWENILVTYTNHEGNRKFGTEQGHTGYEKNEGAATSTITYKFTAVDDRPVYMYIPSNWPRKATFSVSGTVYYETEADAAPETTIGEDGESYLAPNATPGEKTVKYKNNVTYLSNDTHGIIEIGKFTPGEEVTVTFTQSEEKFYTINHNKFFYSFDMDAFLALHEKMQECSMEVTSFKEDRLEGAITADRNNMDVLTTIPYDKGWHVLVDGEEVKTKKALDSLMTFEVDKGEHDIEMYYMSDSYKLGMTITVSGILLFVIACVGDAVIGKCIRRKKALRDGQALLAECADAETPDTDVYDEVLSESGSAEADTDAE
ncbi:MAG: YfhO family protein [Clostridia bacterium]|nr:YfhO family protein [Clostridia bacterium]